jgi:6-pyruvoyl-tetrahydropterin synthase
MDKEHKLIQFMLDNSDNSDHPEDITIENLLTMFLKQKASAVPEQSHPINPNITKAQTAKERIKEEKHEAFAQSKAALAR